MSCVSDSRMAPVSGSCRLSTSVPRRPRDAFLIFSTADSGWCFGARTDSLAVGRSRTSVDIVAGFLEAMLYVDLLVLVAREGDVQAMQRIALERLLPLELVQEIVVQRAAAEEQPVASGRTRRLALLHEAAERRHAGARADHDDVARTVGGHAEAFVTLDPHLHVRIHGCIDHEVRGSP